MPARSSVVISKMLECQGHGGHWLAAVTSLPPPSAVRATILLNPTGNVANFEARPASLSADPPTPPPRFAVV
jgi:hypothetical protein